MTFSIVSVPSVEPLGGECYAVGGPAPDPRLAGGGRISPTAADEGGWGWGAQLTGRKMRAHFTICPHRPAASDHVNRRGRNSKVKRGSPPGRRMPCGWMFQPSG